MTALVAPLLPLAHAGHWLMGLPPVVLVLGLLVLTTLERRRERRTFVPSAWLEGEQGDEAPGAVDQPGDRERRVA